MRILYFGVYNPAYSRNRAIGQALRSNANLFNECRVKPGRTSWLRLLKAYWPLRNSFDVMAVGFPGQEAMFLARLLTRKPIIFDAFTSHYGGYVLDRERTSPGSIRARYYRFLDKWSCMLADAVLLDTQAHIDFFMREYGLSARKFHRIWVGADAAIMRPQGHRVNYGPFTVHFHGHYIPHHGALAIVRAAAQVRNKDILFRLVGQGQQRPQAERLARELGVSNIEFVPNVSYDRLGEYVRTSDVCLGVFGTNPKTFLTITNKIFEAAASERPVITVDSPAVRELFTDGQDIVLSKPDSPEHLARLIDELYENRERAAEIGKNARRTFDEKCSDPVLAKLVGAVLGKIAPPGAKAGIRKKVAITGCGGMLGEAVYGVFSADHDVVASDIDTNEPWLEYLDVTDPKAVGSHLEAVRPDVVVHLAAWTDMEQCQERPEEAYDVNARGVGHTLDYARLRDIPFVYISTAGVFDGEQESYDEGDAPNPLSVYGKSKYLGELLARSYQKSIVVRAGWMMGGGPKKDKKFINKFIRQIREGKTQLHAVHDKIGTPCYTYDLARALAYLVEHEHFGIFHGACEGGASRYDVARFIIEELGLTEKVSLASVDSGFFAKDFFAPRPYSEQMNNNTLKAVNPSLTRHWRECVREYLKKYDWLSGDGL